MNDLEARLENLEGALMAHRSLLKLYLKYEPGIRAGIEEALPKMRTSAPWSTLKDNVRDGALVELALMLAP